jgi:hypothetical protein
MRSKLICAVGFVATASTVNAATVIVNDNLKFGHNQTVSLLWQVSVAKCIDCGTTQPFALFGYNFDGHMRIEGRGITLDEGVDLYLANPGQVFSRKTIFDDKAFTQLVGRGPTGGIFNPQEYFVGDDFYLAANTGVGFNFPEDRNVYGWVHLKVINGALSMLENAVAYRSDGNIIGTTRVVPEPATAALVLPLVAILFVYRQCACSQHNL